MPVLPDKPEKQLHKPAKQLRTTLQGARRRHVVLALVLDGRMLNCELPSLPAIRIGQGSVPRLGRRRKPTDAEGRGKERNQN